MHIPIQTNLPRLDRLMVEWHGRHFSLPYFYRDGTGGPHGLRNADFVIACARLGPLAISF